MHSRSASSLSSNGIRIEGEVPYPGPADRRSRLSGGWSGSSRCRPVGTSWAGNRLSVRGGEADTRRDGVLPGVGRSGRRPMPDRREGQALRSAARSAPGSAGPGRPAPAGGADACPPHGACEWPGVEPAAIFWIFHQTFRPGERPNIVRTCGGIAEGGAGRGRGETLRRRRWNATSGDDASMDVHVFAWMGITLEHNASCAIRPQRFGEGPRRQHSARLWRRAARFSGGAKVARHVVR
jgi:hypothetical protein